MRRSILVVLIFAGVTSMLFAQETAPTKPKAEPKPTTKPSTKPAAKGELTDALEILKKVDAAAKAVESARYESELVGLEAAEPLVGKLRATIVAAGTPTDPLVPTPQKYWVDAKFERPGDGGTVHFTGGCDGENYMLIDHATKTAYQDIDPAVLGSGARVLAGGMMIELLHQSPFGDELKGSSQKLLGSKIVGGVDCYEIHIVYNLGQRTRQPEATWYFGKKDFLPRRRVDKVLMPDGSSAGVQRTISKLEVNPKLEKDAFEQKIPAGYTKTDDFAP